jgi:PAS domain S-box-containing protein
MQWEPRPQDFKLLFQCSPGLFLILREDFTIVAVTEAYLGATMTRREEIIGKNVFEVFPDNPDDPSGGASNLRASLQRAIATRQADTMPIQKYDIRKPAEQGGEFEERYWSPINTPVYYADGRFAYLIHRVEDVTSVVQLSKERQKAREERSLLEEQLAQSNRDVELIAELLKSEQKALTALKESEEQFHTFVDAIPPLAWMAKADGWIFWYNQRWYEYTGTTPADMEGWGWQSVHDPSTLPDVLTRWRTSIATGKPFEMIFPLRGADGIFRPFLTRIRPFRDAEGKIIRWFGTNTDLTEEQRRKEELEQAVAERTAQLKQSMDEMEAFTYSVSHDLRSPLRAVQGFSQALLEDHADELDPEAKDFAVRIKNAAERMMDLISDLLSYSKLRQIQLELSPVNLSHAVQQAMAQLTVVPNARIEIDVPPELHVCGNATTLIQVIANLVSNGLKFHQEKQGAQVEVNCRVANGWVRLCVRDHGIGIAPEHQARVFNVFERLHGSDEYPGTGVGLAIVARGIERMNGRYGVNSIENSGSEFWIELPMSSTVQETHKE